MQNKKKKSTDPQQNICIFIKLQARPCSFLEEKKKKKKKKFVLPTDRIFFSMLAEHSYLVYA